MPHGKTIVYVEDDYEDQELLSEAFAAVNDHSLRILSNGVELFSFLSKESESVCLLVLDINLPFRSGLEIVNDLKTSGAYSNIPVVVFTTGVNSPQAKELRKWEIPVVEKPATFQQLTAIADELLQYCLHHSQ